LSESSIAWRCRNGDGILIQKKNFTNLVKDLETFTNLVKDLMKDLVKDLQLDFETTVTWETKK
jgi:hypothetical protein